MVPGLRPPSSRVGEWLSPCLGEELLLGLQGNGDPPLHVSLRTAAPTLNARSSVTQWKWKRAVTPKV